MAVYYTNEAAFEIPDLGWVDRTVTTLDGATTEWRAHSLVVQRSPIPAGKDLAAVVAGNLDQASRHLRAHKLIFQREREVAGVPAIEVGTQWRGAMQVIYTRQAHLFVGDLWVVVGGNAPLDDRATCDEYMDRALETLRLRD